MDEVASLQTMRRRGRWGWLDDATYTDGCGGEVWSPLKFLLDGSHWKGIDPSVFEGRSTNGRLTFAAELVRRDIALREQGDHLRQLRLQ